MGFSVFTRVAQYRGISAVFGIIRIFIIFCINTHYIYTPGGHGLRRGSVADLLAHRGTCGVWGVVGARYFFRLHLRLPGIRDTGVL